jgi:hypothetical protein
VQRSILRAGNCISSRFALSFVTFIDTVSVPRAEEAAATFLLLDLSRLINTTLQLCNWYLLILYAILTEASSDIAFHYLINSLLYRWRSSNGTRTRARGSRTGAAMRDRSISQRGSVLPVRILCLFSIPCPCLYIFSMGFVADTCMLIRNR